MLNKIRKMLKQQEGFTLVELMIVVVILGILGGIGVQQYGKVQIKAKVSAHNANVRIIEGAAQMYLMSGGSAIDTAAEVSTTGVKDYLQVLPKAYDDSAFTIQITGTEGAWVVTVAPGLYKDDGTPVS